MEHSDIEQASWIDRYVQGTLPAGERGAFEEHFVDCDQCLAQLESARGLRDGLRTTPVKTVAPVRRPPAMWPRWAMAASVVVALAPSFFLSRKLARTRTELLGAERQLTDSANADSAAPAAYVLNETRGGNAELAPVDIPPRGQWLVLLVQLDLSSFKTVTAVLNDSTGKTVWQSGSLRPTAADALAVSVPSRVLKPGEYTLDLEGVRFSFRAR